MGGDQVGGVALAYGLVPGGHIIHQFFVDKTLPVDEVGITEDGAEAGRVDLVPAGEIAVPGFVEAGQGAVFIFEPSPEFGPGARAETELGVGDEVEGGPVDDMGFAPEVPPEESRGGGGHAGGGGVKAEDGLFGVVVVGTHPGGCLGMNLVAAVCLEEGMREIAGHPVGCRIDINLDEHPEPGLFGKPEQEFQVPEIVFSPFRLTGCPFDPGADGIESQGLDLLKVAPPFLFRLWGDGGKHGCPGLPSAIPDRKGKKIKFGSCRFFLRPGTQGDGHQKDEQNLFNHGNILFLR